MLDCCLGYVKNVWTALDKSSTDSCVRMTILIIAALGTIKLLGYLCNFVCAVLSLFRFANPRKYGAWAVVTGATDGIGLAYAKKLAGKGMNIVIIGRDASKLSTSANEIKAKYQKAEVKTIQADFSRTDIYNSIAEQLKGLEIGVLVNNVGKAYDHPEFFSLISDQLADQLININIRSVTFMTKIVLPGMMDRKKGAIINIGSAAGVIRPGDPLHAVYAGVKAFVNQFSVSLALECKAKGVVVQNHIPYFVTSKMSKIRNSSLTVPNPSGWSQSSLSAIGYGGSSVVPYWSHRIQHAILQCLPTWISGPLILSMSSNTRKRALKKKQDKDNETKKN